MSKELIAQIISTSVLLAAVVTIWVSLNFIIKRLWDIIELVGETNKNLRSVKELDNKIDELDKEIAKLNAKIMGDNKT